MPTISQNQPAPPPYSPAARWFWPVLLAATIFGASGRSHIAAPPVVDIDKIGHFLVFGLIATLVARTFRRRRWVWFAILITSTYGALDEFRQSFTPGRSVEFADWIADTLGAILAVTLYQRWHAYRHLLETSLIRPRTPKPRIEKPAAPAADSPATPAP